MNVLDTAMRPLHEEEVEEHFHSAEEGWWAEVMALERSEDSLREAPAGERPKASGQRVAGNVHCWDSKGSSCSVVNMP